MKLILQTQLKQLIANGSAENAGKDHKPVVKLFTPWTGCTWLLTEILPDNPDIAFGLCDLGMGFPELGYVSLAELQAIKGPFGLSVERDICFEATYPLSVYTKAANIAEGITENPKALAQASHSK